MNSPLGPRRRYSNHSSSTPAWRTRPPGYPRGRPRGDAKGADCVVGPVPANAAGYPPGPDGRSRVGTVSAGRAAAGREVRPVRPARHAGFAPGRFDGGPHFPDNPDAIFGGVPGMDERRRSRRGSGSRAGLAARVAARARSWVRSRPGISAGWTRTGSVRVTRRDPRRAEAGAKRARGGERCTCDGQKRSSSRRDAPRVVVASRPASRVSSLLACAFAYHVGTLTCEVVVNVLPASPPTMSSSLGTLFPRGITVFPPCPLGSWPGLCLSFSASARRSSLPLRLPRLVFLVALHLAG